MVSPALTWADSAANEVRVGKGWEETVRETTNKEGVKGREWADKGGRGRGARCTMHDARLMI